MKKFSTLVIWIALLLSVSLLTTSLAAANTVDPNPGNLSEKAPSIPLGRSGGPDTFGYTYQDEVDIGVYHPTFDAVDISSTGTPLSIASDDAAANITAADLAVFDFSFYGTAVTSLRVGNNGAILVNADPADKISFSNVCLGYPSAPANIIAPWWDDWDKTATSAVYWQRDGSGSNERLIIEWHNMQHYQAATYTDPVTFKVILYERGNLIEFHYDDATSNAGITRGASGTIGIRNSSTDYLEYSCETESLVDQRAIRFQQNTITIIKDASPPDTQGFSFTTTITDHISFSLYDDTDPLTPDREITHPLPGVYTVSEAAVTNWGLASLICTTDIPPGNITTILSTQTAVINMVPGEHVTCTFANQENSAIGSITVIKDAVPNNSQDFLFTSDVPNHLSFSLDDDPANSDMSNTRQMLNLTSGTYAINEGTLPSGWSLTDLVCDGGGTNTSVNLAGRSATIGLDTDENITCVFTNTNSTIDESADVYLPLVLKNW